MANSKSPDPSQMSLPWWYTRRWETKIVFAFLYSIIACTIILSYYVSVAFLVFFNISNVVPLYSTNCTMNSELFNNATEVSKRISPSMDRLYTADALSPVYLWARVTLMVIVSLVCLHLCLSIARESAEETYSQAIEEHSLISLYLSDKLRAKRNHFIFDNVVPEKTSETHRKFTVESSADESKEESECSEYLYNMERITLEMAMFDRKRSFEVTFNFMEDLLCIYKLLRCINFIHGKKIYHLNLQPRNVYKHYQQRPSGKREHSTIFFNLADFLTKSKGVQKPYDTVRCSEFYRAPECFERTEVNAGKVDSWGVGIIAFELLTGGMLAISSNYYQSVRRCSSILNLVLNKRYLSSAINNRFEITKTFNYIRYHEIKFEEYNLVQAEFLEDCWTFVSGLLKVDCEARFSVQQALNTRLMKKVQVHMVEGCPLFFT